MTEEKLNIRTRALAFMMLSLIVLFIIAPIAVVLIMPESGSILLNYIVVNGPFIILFLFLFVVATMVSSMPSAVILILYSLLLSSDESVKWVFSVLPVSMPSR